MREIRGLCADIDIWFGDDYIKCPKCGENLTNILCDFLVEAECDGCGKKFEIRVKYFISEVK